MNHQVKLKRTNRIAEYFVVVSAPDILCPIDETEDDSFKLTRSNFMSARFESTIIDRYPLVDRKDSKLPEGVEYFCLPTGLRLLPEYNKPLFHSFVHTTDDGSRKLGCCLTIFEKLSKSQQDSLFALLATEDEIAQDVAEQEELISRKRLLTSIAEVDNEEDQSDKLSRLAGLSVRSFQERTLREQISSLYIPKCLCLISSWPFVTAFKKFLVGLYNISRAKALKAEDLSLRFSSSLSPEASSSSFSSMSPQASNPNTASSSSGNNNNNFNNQNSDTNTNNNGNSTSMETNSSLLVPGSPGGNSNASSSREYFNIGRSSKAEIPLERWICNFLDDVPAPPAGKVDIIYYLADQVLSFRCPPANEPNVWSGLPIFALFECLSPENICTLFGLVLTERQILFVSSQYSLLTACAEAITSLIYPLAWSHAYIPILPYQLLGVLGAPFPFILGLHSSVYVDQSSCTISDETVRVLLDENRIIFGSLGPPPALPERRLKKLLAHIYANANVFENRASKWHPVKQQQQSNSTQITPSVSSNTASFASPSRVNNFESCTDDWHLTRMPYFDDAYSSVSDKETFLGLGSNTTFNESMVREGFLKFFVAILKNYKKYLIYGNSENPDPMVKFKFQEFLNEHPADWQPFIRDMIDSQAFSQFIDERVLLFKQDQDVLYFDESIDAKMNRYTFKFRNIDTPFLLDSSTKHIKTYVSPSPDTSGLLTLLSTVHDSNRRHSGNFSDEFDADRFPRLNPLLYSKPRQIVVQFDGNLSGYAVFNQIRLKRKSNYVPPPNNVVPAHAAVYSCYLTIISTMICVEMQKLAETLAAAKAVVVPSTQYLVQEYSHANNTSSNSVSKVVSDESLAYSTGSRERVDSGERSAGGGAISGAISTTLNGTPDKADPNNHSTVRGRSASRAMSMNMIVSPTKPYDMNKYHDDYQATAKACKLALRVAFEALNCLSRLDYAPQESVFRCLADACGACGDSDCIIDLLVYMDDQGLLPDHQMLHAVVRALAANPPPPPPPAITSSETSSTITTKTADNTAAVAATTATAPTAPSTSSSTTRRIYSLFRGSTPVPGSAASSASAAAPAASSVTSAAASATPSVAGDPAILSANSTEKRDRAESVVGNLTLPTRLRNKVISPIEVWTFTDWRSLQRGQSSLVRRRTPTVTTENAANESKMTKLLFGPSAVAQDGSMNRPPLSSGGGGSASASGAEKDSGSSGSSATTTASSLLYSLPSAAVHAVVAVPTVALHTVAYVPSVALHTVASVLAPNHAHGHTAHGATGSSASSSGTGVGIGGASSGQPLQITATPASMAYSDSSFRWSSSVLTDGVVPKLQWSNLASPTRHPIFYASKKLYRHMRICEKKLMESFPDLNIELESPFGTLCPNKKCPIRRPLTMGEIHQGWNENAGDANKYTTKCIHCGQEFIPRVQIICKIPTLRPTPTKSATLSHLRLSKPNLLSCVEEEHHTTVGGTTAATDNTVSQSQQQQQQQQPFSPSSIMEQQESSVRTPDSSSASSSVINSSHKSGDSYEFWCELLSPWVLGKELLNILYQDGINSVLDCHFLRPGNSISVQRMIVFWNMLISFRLRGLPYTFLLSNESIVQAFPLPPPPATNTTNNSSSNVSSANSSMRPPAATSAGAKKGSSGNTSTTVSASHSNVSALFLPVPSTSDEHGSTADTSCRDPDTASVGGVSFDGSHGRGEGAGSVVASVAAMCAEDMGDVSFENATVASTTGTEEQEEVMEGEDEEGNRVIMKSASSSDGHDYQQLVESYSNS